MVSTKTKQVIKTFEKAVEGRVELLWCGPVDHKLQLAVEHNYVKARAKLERLLEEKELQK
jgi:hypothetical protein